MGRRRHMDVKERDRPGRAGIPWDSVRHATLIATTVAVPLIVGIGTGHDSAWAAATLGAYLWTIGHITNPHPIGVRMAGATAILMGVAGMAGALAGRHLWVLLVMLPVWAALQAVTETAGTALRMPAAMAALCFLLSAIGGGATAGGALWRGLLVLGGASWVALSEMIFHRLWRPPEVGTRDLGLAELAAAWPKSRGYALLLILPTMLSAGVLGVFQISHGAWMATTVLRVLRADASVTIARSGRRIAGTSGGALLAAVLLGSERRAVTGVIVLTVCLSAMQIVGPKRYGVYTFFLTLLALDLTSVGQAASWHLALTRVLLTLAGAALAVTSGFLYDRITRPREDHAAERARPGSLTSTRDEQDPQGDDRD
jgi:Fusaric acid resistance protein-like